MVKIIQSNSGLKIPQTFILKSKIVLLSLLIIVWMGGIFYVVNVVGEPSTYYYQTNGLSMGSYFAEQNNNQLIALAMASMAFLMVPILFIAEYYMELKNGDSKCQS